MKKENFLTYYAGLSNVELLKIVEEKEKYQPGALEAAKEILSERNYSNDELNAAQAEINLLVNKRIERQEKINKKINSIHKFIDEYFGIRERSAEKILNLFCAGLFLYIFFCAIFNIKFLANLFYYKSIKGYIVAVLIYSIQFLFIYLLYKRNNWGWAFIVIGCVVLSMQNIQNFFESFIPRDGFLDFLYAPINPYYEALSFCINIGVVLFLISKRIEQQFGITKNGRMTTILIAIGISAFLFILQYI